MIATDASGSNAAALGTTREHVESLTVVWDHGERDDLALVNSDRTQTIARGLKELLRERERIVENNRSRAPFDRCGYRLHDVLTPKGIDLKQILVGSEGTLGLVTGAVLKTIPLPTVTMAMVIGFASIERATTTGVSISKIANVVACDFLDRRLLALGQGLTIPSDVEAILIVTIEADSSAIAEDTSLAVTDRAREGRVIVEPTDALDGVLAIRQFRRSALSALYAIGAGARPTAIIEDLGVPPDALPECLAKIQALLRRRNITATMHAHCPMGVVHLLPLVDLDLPGDRDRLWPLADELYAIVHEYRGRCLSRGETDFRSAIDFQSRQDRRPGSDPAGLALAADERIETPHALAGLE
jgi:FAD/FMN-containing dehydrogenase